MDVKQNPFSVYDFLGYIIPGALCGYMLVIGIPFSGIAIPQFLRFPSSLFRHPDVYIPFAIGSYVIGHLLSYLSSIFVERYAIWSFGYPSAFLLGTRSGGYFSSIPDDKLAGRRKAIRVAFWIMSFPFTTLDTVLEKTLCIREIYAKPLDKCIATLIKRKMWIFFGTEFGIFRAQRQKPGLHGAIGRNGADLFRAIYHYALDHYPSHVPSMKNYVAIYGFLRTITFLLTILFWCAVAKIIFFGWLIYRSSSLDLILMHKLYVIGIFLVFSWIGAYIFFMAFVKFHRRFTLEALMALAANYNVEPPENFEDPFAVEFLTRPPNQPAAK